MVVEIAYLACYLGHCIQFSCYICVPVNIVNGIYHLVAEWDAEATHRPYSTSLIYVTLYICKKDILCTVRTDCLQVPIPHDHLESSYLSKPLRIERSNYSLVISVAT